MTDQLDHHLDRLGEELDRGIARAERRRRRALGGTCAATVLAAIGLGALVAFPGGRTLDPVEAARAAVADGDGILHYVVSLQFIPPSGSTVRRAPKRVASEVWTVTSGVPRSRVVTPADRRPRFCSGTSYFVSKPRYGAGIGSSPGLVTPLERSQRGKQVLNYSVFSRAAVAQDVSGRPEDADRTFWYGEGIEFGADDARDPIAPIRSALQGGLLRDAGRSVLDRREVRRLVGRDGPSFAEARALRTAPYTTRGSWRRAQVKAGRPLVPTRYTIFVDATTFLPVEVRIDRYVLWSRADGRDHWKWTRQISRFEGFKRLPMTAANERLLEIELPKGTKVYRPSVSGGYESSPGAGRAGYEAALRRCRAAMR